MDQLTGRVLSYQRTGRGSNELFSEIMRRVYVYPTRRFGLREDDCGDFLLFFYPRIRLTLLRFENRGKPFASYLYTTLKYQIRTYIAIRNREKIRRATADSPAVCNTVFFESDQIAENPPLYDPVCNSHPPPSLRAEIGEVLSVLTAVPRSRAQTGANARRIVIMAMKCCLRLNDEDIAELALVTGFDVDRLHNGWLELRACMQVRLARIAMLQNRRSAAFFQIQYAHMRIKTTAGPQMTERLQRILELHRGRYRRAGRLLQQVPLAPSNVEISRALGIPKGSVDSTVHYLRKVVAQAGLQSGR